MDVAAEGFQTGTAAWRDVGFEEDIAAAVDAESGRAEERGAAPRVDMKQRAAVGDVVPECDVGIAADYDLTGSLVGNVAEHVAWSGG